jgi:hypothetical protein
LGKEATCSRFISDFKADLRSEVLGLYFVFYPSNGSVRNSKEKRKKRNRRGRKPRERAMQQVRAKVVHAQKAVQETFFSVKVHTCCYSSPPSPSISYCGSSKSSLMQQLFP